MEKILLQMSNISKCFGAVKALDNVSITLNRGEIHALCGENGAGKSTLMKILSGSFPCTSYSGEIYLNGKEAKFHNTKDAENAGIEMIYQEISLHLDLSVAENLLLGHMPGTFFVSWQKVYENARQALKLVELKVDPHERVRNLSTSQQQLLAIARALIRRPHILVLDEPTSALTEKEADHLFSILHGLKKTGLSCLYISHKLEEVFQIANRISIIRDGRFISCYGKEQACIDRVIEDMVGRKLENLYPKVNAEIGDEILSVKDLFVPHPYTVGKDIVDGVSFSLRRGEILGIAGLVGSGRSELLDAIFRARKKNVRGEIFLEGKKVAAKTPLDSKKLGMGYLTEDRKRNGFIWTMDIKHNLTLASFDQVFGKWFIRRKHEERLAREYFRKLSIKAPDIRTMVVNLSGGNQQKVVLAKWMMTDIKVLLLDEPTRGIDVGAKAEIYKLISTMAQQGMAIIMVSSEMPELLALCDRFLVLSNGKIRGEFLKSEVTQEKIMKAATVMNCK